MPRTMPSRCARDETTRSCVVSASAFDWNAVPENQRTFDLVLACDVLYETHAVEPVSELVAALTRPRDEQSAWLVADPPERAPRNRERFLERVGARGFFADAPRRATVTHGGSTDTVLLLEIRANGSRDAA